MHMVDSLRIDNPELAQRIQQLADAEQRSVEEILEAMVAQYHPMADIDETEPTPEEMARKVQLGLYQKARDYWAHVGEHGKAELTDEEMDKQFYLFDLDGIPRLKSEKDSVDIQPGTLAYAGKVLKSAQFRSGQSGISQRAREIMEGEFTDYLLHRKRPLLDGDHDDDSP
jgi:predicted transcriptional regulator